MSYDLRLCRPEPGRAPEEIATGDAAESEAPPSPEEVRRMQAMASVLAAAMPELACDEGWESAEAGGIEFSALDTGTGLQVLISPREIGMTIPYSHGPESARQALAAMWRCAGLMEREGGFFTYDPQVGRVLSLDKDFDLVVSTYARAMERIGRAAPAKVPGRTRAKLFPAELDRLGYLLRWLALAAVALVLGYGILQLSLGSRTESLVLAPVAAWFVAKMLVIDPARLRSIGWPPALTFLSLFPPAAIGLQLLLFLLSPRDR